MTATPITEVWGVSITDVAWKVTSRGRRVAARLAEGRPRAAGYALLREAGYVWSPENALTDEQGTALASACCAAPPGFTVAPFAKRFMVDSSAWVPDPKFDNVKSVLCVRSNGQLARAGDSWATEIAAVCAAWKAAVMLHKRFEVGEPPYPCHDCGRMTTTADPCFDLCARCEREYVGSK